MRATRVIAVIVAAEGLVLAAWLTSSPASVVAIVQTLVAMLLVLSALIARCVALRTRLHDDIATDAITAERARIAEEMHDALGHELSLIAVQLGALQVAHPEAAERTESIRRGAQRATEALHDILTVVPAPAVAAEAPLTPGAVPLPRLIDTVRSAGVVLHAEIDDLDDLPAIVRDTVHKIAREGITNAQRHAPSQPMTLSTKRTAADIIVLITNPVDERHAAGNGPGTGLTTLRRRLELLGGALTGSTVDGVFALSATVPRQPQLTSTTPAHRSTPRARRRVLLSVALPSTSVLAALLGYYTWAVQGATTDLTAMAHIHPGMTETAATRLLPARQAPVRLPTPSPPADVHACRYYTDGNFPLGYASWRICFRAGVVESVDDLR